jgi:hypothetical protein
MRGDLDDKSELLAASGTQGHARHNLLDIYCKKRKGHVIFFAKRRGFVRKTEYLRAE